jgi:hypothetical protein
MDWNLIESKMSNIKDIFIDISELDNIDISFSYGYAGLSYIIGDKISTYDHLIKLVSEDMIPSDIIFYVDIKSSLYKNEADIEMWGQEHYESMYSIKITREMLSDHILLTSRLMDVYQRLENFSNKILLDTKFLNYSFIISPI